MSAEPQPTSYECSFCDSAYESHDPVAGSYCSLECYYRDKGEGVLHDIQQDHRFCSTCFRQVKTVEHPPDQWLEDASSILKTALDAGAEIVGREGQLTLDATDAETKRSTAADSVVGFQYPTEFTTFGEDLTPEERRRRLEDQPTANRSMRGTWGCECGAVDLADHDRTLELVEGHFVFLNLLRCLLTYYREGAIEQRPSKDRLFDAFREHGREFDLAIGEALFGK